MTINNHSAVRYSTEVVDGVDIFYREAGDASKTTIVLLHGFPASSHMYRQVLANLGDEFHVVAPDYPGFGNSAFPDPANYAYTFDNLAATIDRFLEQRKIREYVLMIHDYGAPVGFRIALNHPERLKGFVVMNGNAYEEGFHPENTAPVAEYWKSKSSDLEEGIASQLFSLEGIQWQYTHGTRNPGAILPDNWRLDFANLQKPGQHRMQLDLFFDYQNNVKQYPQWQSFLRESQPPMLITWGKHDPFFPTPGAEAYRKDVKRIDFHLLDTGHFALEEESPFIIEKIRIFLRSI